MKRDHRAIPILGAAELDSEQEENHLTSLFLSFVKLVLLFSIMDDYVIESAALSLRKNIYIWAVAILTSSLCMPGSC